MDRGITLWNGALWIFPRRHCKAAREQFRWKAWRDHLRNKNVRLLAGGIDEVPGAYKDIHEVMRAQADLVDVIGAFQPVIVMMCGDGSPAED